MNSTNHLKPELLERPGQWKAIDVRHAAAFGRLEPPEFNGDLLAEKRWWKTFKAKMDEFRKQFAGCNGLAWIREAIRVADINLERIRSQFSKRK